MKTKLSNDLILLDKQVDQMSSCPKFHFMLAYVLMAYKPILFFLLCINATFLGAQGFSECLSVENDLEYVYLESFPSKTSVEGFVEGGRFTHHYRYGRFGFSDMAYAGHGVLKGEDAFDDDVSIHYTEYDGEFWLTYLFCGKSYSVSPFIGWGFRQHRNKKTKPTDLLLETSYGYLPVGVRLNTFLTQAVGFGAHAKAEILTYTWWKFHHPVFIEKSNEIQKCAAFEAKAWMTYWIAPQWRAVLAGSFRYLELLFPEDVSFAPEPKRQLNFGFRAGLDYHY